MNAITQAIVNNSTLEITRIKITDATKTSFLMSLECKVENTGPISATMTPMTLSMSGNAGCFGTLTLPEIKTSSSGTTITVTEQRIEIVDMDAFVAFNKSIICDDSLTLHLTHGTTTIKALFLTTKTTYQKSVHLKGMSGPITTMLSTTSTATSPPFTTSPSPTSPSPTSSPHTFTNTMRALNPSPLEIDLGTLHQELRNARGETIATQKGRVYFGRGETTYVMRGEVTGVEVGEGEVRVLGVGVEEDNWNNLTMVHSNTATTVTEEFVALCKAGGKA
ncbi:hypothetical protein LARI1_G005105 [Lachnellula arida]|uniref:Uncharacterized protein n=1 Tax=Lachnellula arida TaxID=1316785 RepID=A0A8T9BGN0_9HELO|nr:hypothetical protein LARI1_G005105 [Lachnellula arida]